MNSMLEHVLFGRVFVEVGLSTGFDKFGPRVSAGNDP